MRGTESRTRIVLTGLAAVALLATVAASETSVIEQRQAAMEEIGSSMKALAAIAKKEAPFEVAVVKSNAGSIAEHLELASGLFPEGSDSGDVETWAKAEIWSDRASFDQSLEDARQAALALQAVTEEADFMPALGNLGNGCKSCHDPLRRPKS